MVEKYRKEIRSLSSQSPHVDSSLSTPLTSITHELVIDKIIPSPVTEGYRNKCEFAIGKNELGDVRVGFTLGAYKDGIITVASPASCKNVAPVVIDLVTYLETFIVSSGISSYDRVTQIGFWRLVTIRTFSSGQGRNTKISYNDIISAFCFLVMVLFQVQKDDIKEEELIRIRSELVEYLKLFSFTDPNTRQVSLIASIQWQIVNSKAFAFDMSIPFELLYGEPTLIEHLCGYQFYVSANSFFQVNLYACELLYAAISSLAISLPKETCNEGALHSILLDLCCGAGTIGISCSKYFKKIIGIEVIPGAIHDARLNSHHNSKQ